MTTEMPAFEGDIQKLTEGYVQRLEQSAEALNNILSQISFGDLKRDDLQRAQNLAHGLAGSGTLFGFPEITEVGRETDLHIAALLEEFPVGRIPDEEQSKLQQKLMKLLKACNDNAQNKSKAPAKELFGGLKTQALPKTFHVVVVDDDPQVSQLLESQLRHHGIIVTLADNGTTAIRAISRNMPDLVILDISMPDMTGHEVLRELKQTPGLVNIPILMLTGNTSRSEEVNAYQGGAIDFVVKPFDPTKLMKRIEDIMEAARYTVMIVDNDELVQQLLDSKFRHAGFRTILINDGKQAWARIQHDLPDLIILDRMMPGLEGLAVLKNMREDPQTAKIPVIILSARQEERDIQIGMQMGAQAYIAKPFITEDLLEQSLALLKKDKVKLSSV
jgi:DNA-binding response OmpR family regulator